MDNSGFIKLGPVGDKSGNVWEEQGRSRIERIFISHDEDIKSIQFQYVENRASVLSARHGPTDGNQYDVVNLNHPSEYITWISGHKRKVGDSLCSITFGTNHGKYGPFGSFSKCDDKEFSFRVGDTFGGFHGTANSYNLTSIGVFLKPVIRTISLDEFLDNCMPNDDDDENYFVSHSNNLRG